MLYSRCTLSGVSTMCDPCAPGAAAAGAAVAGGASAAGTAAGCRLQAASSSRSAPTHALRRSAIRSPLTQVHRNCRCREPGETAPLALRRRRTSIGEQLTGCACSTAASTERTQRSDALIQRRVAHEQPLDAAADLTVGNAERGELPRGQRLVRVALQLLERVDHLVGAGELCAAAVGTELTVAREPHDDDVGEDAEQYLQHDDDREGGDATAIVGAEHRAVDDAADHP